MSADRPGKDFIRQIVERDLEKGRYDGVVTRFPPEPNGFPHIGHAKSIVLNFGVADEHGGRTHLRFDDTNPTTEDTRYVEAIEDAVRWLGYEWDELYHASDYFEQLYDFAVTLIRKGKAYVDSQSEEEIRENRGSVTEAGTDSPFRTRSVEENLDLFERMRAGEFPDGSHVLRARIDMAHPNMVMRDPLLFRILHTPHYRRGDEWVIYPLYDFAHGLSDAIEGVTHSFCTLEFENNREIYDWLVDEVGFEEPRPHQYEFARLNLDYTVMSKRKLKRLVDDGHVSGWDDPRMPTLAGLRRRGYTPQAIRTFCTMIGVARADSRVDVGKLEYAIRDDLNRRAPRAMAVLDPLAVTITNWPPDDGGDVEIVKLDRFPPDARKDGGGGSDAQREVPLSGRLFIERGDFAEEPPKGFRRLVPGGEVWLKGAYALRCDELVKGPDGALVELRCSVDFGSRNGRTADGRKIRGTVHWVSADHHVEVPVRLYDRLFSRADPEELDDFLDALNPESLLETCALAEPGVAGAAPGDHLQFERVGYFFADPEVSEPGAPVFNRVVTLKDTWSGRNRPAAAQDSGPKPDPRPERGRTTVARRPPEELAAEAGPPVTTRFERLSAMGIDAGDALTIGSDDGLIAFFDAAAAGASDSEAIANWVINELPRVAGDRPLGDLPFGGAELGELVGMVGSGTLTGSAAREVLEILSTEGGHPGSIVAARGLERQADPDALAPIVDGILAANPDEVASFRAGKAALIGFFVGQVMRETGGTADPVLVRQLLQKRLQAGEP